MQHKKIVDFGFSLITESEKYILLERIFNSIVHRYDIMNDLMSFGMHRIWKNLLLKCSNIRSEYVTLDLASGTGDITEKLSKFIRSGFIVSLDINKKMLKTGRDKLRNRGIIKNIFYIQANAECLPFKTNTFDNVIVSFGLRNFTQKEKAIQSIFRVLKSGGELLILEFSTPCSKFLKKIYDYYSFNYLPKLGKIVAGNSESYQYLVESIRMHPNQNKLQKILLKSGFYSAEYTNILGGIVAIHKSYKF
ncbi:2-octaprenyl-6-methoxy-1,4-benzoquinone methylase/S-adenosylmethionine:2-DMK methyltransferase [Wigglesworthia glossinidia endosymbiont of Glossina morsitans morsitans (Yale colony)]|uniref:Ubiquinone/menaquinone biosynthesis C-methyltransferase UbiE n=1 Tax=Wigglesworthia glossinidia endosymbiont of Glossina morsitans morsitans (Yale colony) TaxID=1142511 RepID=H6Q4C6_WIGGL|nr:class I SAM-dependent methyltransferase [Wigglesworthia glossinidia]AFA40986.1 2-octaprenyl-6-methoxy-1,4-benzoquinone methylase/S-adenosylmethionine:2-DMK methyltransferase [Wigglesworthia glossinidia endosymbiont of Glossina morsitans morsitans (Yale colony)]